MVAGGILERNSHILLGGLIKSARTSIWEKLQIAFASRKNVPFCLIPALNDAKSLEKQEIQNKKGGYMNIFQGMEEVFRAQKKPDSSALRKVPLTLRQRFLKKGQDEKE